MRKLLSVIFAIVFVLGAVACVKMVVDNGSGSGSGGGSTLPDSSTVTEPCEVHTPGEWIVDEEPECEVEGKKHFECTVCNETLMNDIIPALEHICAEEWTVVTEATCTTAGERVKRCVRSGCGKQLKSEEIPALGHVEVKDNAVAATCTTTGKTEGKHCSRCNTVLTAQTEIPITHTGLHHVNAKEPTCGEDGYEAFDVCITCGWSNQVTIPATWNHTIDESAGAIEEAATCTNSGTKIVSCKVCSFTSYVTIPALGHVEVKDNAVAATCTTAGKTEGKHCSRCNTVLTAQTTIPTLGHTFGEWMTVKEATTTEEGLLKQVCSRCNETNTRVIGVLVPTKTLSAGTYKFIENVDELFEYLDRPLSLGFLFLMNGVEYKGIYFDTNFSVSFYPLVSVQSIFESTDDPGECVYHDSCWLHDDCRTIILSIDQTITEEAYNLLIGNGFLVRQD